MSDNTVITRETKKKNILINNLKSNTSYELKVFIRTHVGFNPERYLFTNFTTEVRSEFILEHTNNKHICFVKCVKNINTFCFTVYTDRVNAS